MEQLFFAGKAYLKINSLVKTPLHEFMAVERSRLWAPGKSKKQKNKNRRLEISRSPLLLAIEILQSQKTMVSRSDWWSNSTLCGWKDQFGNNSPFRTVSRCGQLLVHLHDLGFPRLSLCLSLFGRCLFKLKEALLHCRPTGIQNVLKPRFPIR